MVKNIQIQEIRIDIYLKNTVASCFISHVQLRAAKQNLFKGVTLQNISFKTMDKTKKRQN